ncbi:MAG: 16S rRNA (cytosine(1402)-N(4))-methyltransferase RsmH [Acholeplasmataceae bacterium]
MTHETVLKVEAIAALNIKKDGIYIDGTLGGAGHSEKILENLDQNGHLYAFDQDMFAIDYAKNRLEKYQNITYIHSNFKHITKELNQRGVFGVDGILLDLGLSSFQIDDQARGFTYLKDTQLDMRMDQKSQITAETILNTYDEKELAHMFFVYGEEKNSFKIARRIVEHRPLKTTMDLVKITDQVNYKDKGHSAKRVFQALRIAVNDELMALEAVLKQAIELLNPNGRLVVISFHSLEDRIVKHFIKKYSEHDIPKNLPVVTLPKLPLKVITRKPVYPSDREIEENPRSRSAKMRVAEKQ